MCRQASLLARLRPRLPGEDVGPPALMLDIGIRVPFHHLLDLEPRRSQIADLLLGAEEHEVDRHPLPLVHRPPSATQRSVQGGSEAEASAIRNPSRAVAALTPALTEETTLTRAFSTSSAMPAARAFSMRFRVQTW